LEGKEMERMKIRKEDNELKLDYYFFDGLRKREQNE